MNPDWIKFAGIALNAIGSIILAVRVTNILTALALVGDAHELSIKQIIKPPLHMPMVIVTGATQHVQRAKKKRLLVAGFICIVLGLVAQGVATYLTIQANH